MVQDYFSLERDCKGQAYASHGLGSRDGAVVLASHQCGQARPGATCELSLLLALVVGPAPRVFLWVLHFISLHKKNQHPKFQFKQDRGPA